MKANFGLFLSRVPDGRQEIVMVYTGDICV